MFDVWAHKEGFLNINLVLEHNHFEYNESIVFLISRLSFSRRYSFIADSNLSWRMSSPNMCLAWVLTSILPSVKSLAPFGNKTSRNSLEDPKTRVEPSCITIKSINLATSVLTATLLWLIPPLTMADKARKAVTFSAIEVKDSPLAALQHSNYTIENSVNTTQSKWWIYIYSFVFK